MKTYKSILGTLVTCFALAISFSVNLLAQSTLPLPNKPEGFITDEVGLFSGLERQELESRLSSFRDSTSNVIAIAILQDLRGLSREEVATELFNSWRIWEGERYNGVLILVALDDRQMQIEVGYGLEGAIPDALAGRIVQDVLRPSFRQESYFEGISEAISILIAASSGEYDAVNNDEDLSLFELIVFILFLGMIVMIFLLRGLAKIKEGHTIGSTGIYGSRRSLYGHNPIWTGSLGGFGSGSGSGSGGFGGFSGGGSFGSGGAGAGGGW